MGGFDNVCVSIVLRNNDALQFVINVVMIFIT